ncbi:MAG: DNA-directed RNA polymerase subunit omega [Blautia sp.]|nr:DNA-directed RNA polymerase subunit omega [Blautia sp.]
MIHPSYTELIEAINANKDEGEEDAVLNSRYSLVLATSRRARQLIAGSAPLIPRMEDRKPLSVAIDELYQGKVKILPKKEPAQEEAPALGAGTGTELEKETVS